MKPFFLLLTALPLANFQTAHAQTDFRPGYIVKLAGDTVRGQADYRGALRSGRICRFMATPEAAPTAYRPTELRAYGFAGQKGYRSALTPMPDSLGLAQPPQRFFLELLVTGPASLLARRGRSDETHYYVQKGPITAAPVQELIYRRELVESNGQQYYRADNAFRNTLADALADCPAVSAAVQKAEFKASVLTTLVNRYNQCRQPGTVAPLQNRQAHLSLGVLAGAQTGQLFFHGDIEQALGTFKAPVAPVFGVALHIVNPAINEKLAFRLELQYAQQQYEGEYFLGYGFTSGTRQARFKTACLRIPLLMRYTAPRGAVRPLFELGFEVNAALNIEAEMRVRPGATLPYGDWQPALGQGSLRSLGFGAVAGVGVQLGFPASRPLTILARAERTNGFISAQGFGNYAWNYQLLLGINLTK